MQNLESSVNKFGDLTTQIIHNNNGFCLTFFDVMPATIKEGKKLKVETLLRDYTTRMLVIDNSRNHFVTEIFKQKGPSWEQSISDEVIKRIKEVKKESE